MIVARSPRPVALRRSSSWASVTSLAAGGQRVEVAVVDRPHVLQAGQLGPDARDRRRGGRTTRVTTPTAPESPRIHCTWSDEEVS